jgi:uncharacterized protein (DUF2267 family)
VTTTSENAWANAERRVFEALLDRFEGQEGQNAFIGELPSGVVDAWSFEIGGGSDGFKQQLSTQLSAWVMRALWRGIYRERSDAQAAAGVVRQMLPYHESAGGIHRVDWEEHPRCERDFETGWWTVQYPLMVAFGNVTA